MFNIKNNIDDEFKKNLSTTISDSTISLIDQIFGLRIHSRKDFIKPSDIVVSKVSFWVGLDVIDFFFVFEKSFLETLISIIYTPKDIQDIVI